MKQWFYLRARGGVSASFSKLIGYIVVALAVTGLVSTVALRRSLELGRLAVPTGYDDVVYLLDAQLLLHNIPHQSLLTTVYQLLDQHALMPVLLACAGFVIAPGAGLVGPYCFNSILLLGFLIACIRLLRHLPVPATIGVICAVAAIPLSAFTITELRPDIGWGMITAVAVVAVISTDFFACSPRRVISVGLVIGLSLIGKPSAVPVTFVMVGLAVAGSAAIHWWEAKVPPRPRWASLLMLVGPIVAISGPVYIIIGAQIYSYIITALVTLKDQNAVSGDFFFQWSFYSFGQAGYAAFGNTIYACIIIWIVGFVYTVFYNGLLFRRLVALFLVVIVAYIAPSQTVVKTFFLGSAFYGLVILSTVYVFARLYEIAVSKWPRGVGWPAITVATCATGVCVLIFADVIGHPVGFIEQAEDRRQELNDGTNKVWSVLKEHVLAAHAAGKLDGISRVVLVSPEPINAGWISLYGLLEAVPVVGAGNYYARTLGEIDREIETADYVVATNSIAGQLTGPRFGDALMSEMEARHDFHFIGSYERISGGGVDIYERGSGDPGLPRHLRQTKSDTARPPAGVPSFPDGLTSSNLFFAGVWQDGWVRAHAITRLWLGGGSDILHIRGDIPDFSPKITGGVMTIKVDGALVLRRPQISGEFDLVIPIPRSDETREISFDMTGADTLPADERVVTMHLSSITLERTISTDNDGSR